jgi:hypothetical protein
LGFNRGRLDIHLDARDSIGEALVFEKKATLQS